MSMKQSGLTAQPTLLALLLACSSPLALAQTSELGRVEVELAASQHGPTQVRASGGPRVYRQAIKQAVSRLDCFQAHAGQKFRFQLVFVSPDAAERDTALAGRSGGITLASK